MRAISAAVVLVLALPALLHPGAGEAGGQLLAGAAKRDITPPVTTPMWGYTARHVALATASHAVYGHPPPYTVAQALQGVDTELYAKTFLRSEGVHARVYANAFVLDDGSNPVAIVHVDLGAVPGELHQGVADRLAALGVPIPRERLLLGATHTHGGPGGFFQYPGYALLGGDAFDPRVFGFIADQVAAAVAEAWQEREPATLAVGTALLPGASGNRSSGAHKLGHAADADHVKEQARVLRLDTLEGKPLGAIVNFAAHGTMVDAWDLLMTGDNQGVAWRLVARGIAAAAGLDEHDVVVAYLNGAQGDVSPRGSGPDFFAAVEDSGRRQAPGILTAWQALAGQGTSKVSLDARFRFLCFCGQEVQGGERISPVAILGLPGGDLLGLSDRVGHTLPAPLAVPGHGGKIPLLLTPGGVPQVVRLQALRVNDYVMLAVPGEPSMALGEQLERDTLALGASAADVVGLADDYVSYMSTLPEYDAQEYEGAFNLYGRMTGPLLRQELGEMARALLQGEPVPPGWMSLVEHPDTNVPTPPEAALLPGTPPQVLAQPPAVVQRGASATFAWAGGNPGVEHSPDDAMVEVRDGQGRVVHDDLGFEVWLRYAKVGPDLHRWSAEWRARPEVAPGSYAFHVTGRWLAAPGDVQDYELWSAPFEVP